MESLANLTESQLNTDLAYGRPSSTHVDSETRRNTQLNKFSNFTEDTFNRQLDDLSGYKQSSPDKIVKGDTETDYYVSKRFLTFRQCNN